jgi:hypothetical protein
MWAKQKLSHPYYGRVTNLQLYELDITHHNCDATREIRIKFGFDPERTYNR